MDEQDLQVKVAVVVVGALLGLAAVFMVWAVFA